MFATSGRARLAFDSTGADGGADVLLIHDGDKHDQATLDRIAAFVDAFS